MLSLTYLQSICDAGLDTAGIYRHSGSVSKIQKLRIQANQGTILYNCRCVYFLHFAKIT